MKKHYAVHNSFGYVRSACGREIPPSAKKVRPQETDDRRSTTDRAEVTCAHCVRILNDPRRR